MQQITITVEAPDDIIAGYGAGAVIRVKRGTTSVVAAMSEITTILLVATQGEYEYWDPTGTAAHWYSVRYSSASPSLSTDYSDEDDAVQAGAVEAYATLAELRLSGDWPDTTRDAYLTSLLVDASAMVDTACGRRFYRSPQVSGTSTFTFTVRNAHRRRLSFAIGAAVMDDGTAFDIISVTTLKLRQYTSASQTTLVYGTDWHFVPGEPGFPYADIELSDYATAGFLTLPVGRATGELVGALGFTTPLSMVKRAVIDQAREWYRQGPGGGPAQIGTNQFGTPVYLTGAPPTMRTVCDPTGPYALRSFASV